MQGVSNGFAFGLVPDKSRGRYYSSSSCNVARAVGTGSGIVADFVLGTRIVGYISNSLRAKQLLSVANAPGKNGFTVAGRSLQKHGSRIGSPYPKATGNIMAINSQGESVLKGILSNPNSKTTTRHHAKFGNILEIRAPNGQGVRFSADGKTFLHFLNSNMNNIEIIIASPQDKDELVAEIWINNQMIAELNQENDALELEIYCTDSKQLNFNYDLFTEALKMAKNKLLPES